MRPLRNALLLDAQHFYEELLGQETIDPHIQDERAIAQTRIARISAQWASDQGHRTVSTGCGALEKLITKHAENPKYQANLAEVLNNLGTMLMAVDGGLNEASNLFHQAQKILERLIQSKPKSESHHLQLGLGLRYISEIQERQGKLDDAIGSINRALEIEMRLASEHPESVEPRLALATAHTTLAHLLTQKPAELLTAIANYQQAVELREAITQKYPELVDQSYQLALELSKLGSLQRELGQAQPAIQNLRRALEIFEYITKLYPEIATYQKKVWEERTT